MPGVPEAAGRAAHREGGREVEQTPWVAVILGTAAGARLAFMLTLRLVEYLITRENPDYESEAGNSREDQ